VTYRVVITNTSNPVTLIITSLTDSLYGDIALLPEPNSCDAVIGHVLLPNQSVSCEFTVLFFADAGISRSHVVTVMATTPAGVVVTDSSPARTVTITDVRPRPEVQKSASPASLPAPGGRFTFTVGVRNRVAEPLVLVALRDDAYGNLDGLGNCAAGVTIPSGETYTCRFTVGFLGQSGDRHTNTVTATVVDNEGNSATGQDSASIHLTAPVVRRASGSPVTEVPLSPSSPAPTISPAPAVGPSPTPSPGVTASPSPASSPVPIATAPAPPPGGSGGGVISRTGVDALEWFALALALIMLGSLIHETAPAGRRTIRGKPGRRP